VAPVGTFFMMNSDFFIFCRDFLIDTFSTILNLIEDPIKGILICAVCWVVGGMILWVIAAILGKKLILPISVCNSQFCILSNSRLDRLASLIVPGDRLLHKR
jgi:hypothetical protein